LIKPLLGSIFVLSLIKAFASSMSFRMMAVRATFAGFPAWIMVWYLSLICGLNLVATRAGI